MSEHDYNPEGLSEDQIRIKLLEEGLNSSTKQVSDLTDRLNLTRERWSKAQDDKFRAFEVIKEAVNDGEIDADVEWLSDVAEIFGWDLTHEVSVSYTITGTASVKLPLGKNLDDLSFSAYNVEITCDDDSDIEVDVEDYDLNDFDEQ